MIVVFGTICIDRVRTVPYMPAPGGYVEIEAEECLLGGEAANTAAALKQWGADVRLEGNDIGRGVQADLLRDLLAAKSLKPAISAKAHERTPICDVYVTPDGERTMIGQGFSDLKDTVDLDRLPLTPGAWFTAEPNLGMTAREAVKRAHNAGMRTYTMDFIADDEPIYEGSFWQTSMHWANTVGGGSTDWLQTHIDRYGCFAILTSGPNGFVAGSPTTQIRAYPPFPVPDPVDTTGAGDAFRAGMLFGLDQDWPIARSLQFASAAGALNCRTMGATTDLTSVQEVEDLIAAHPEIAAQYL